MESHPEKARDVRTVPTGMETDPAADEQIIDQTNGESGGVPEDMDSAGDDEPTDEAGTTPEDDLANALAYALDGSGIGMAGAPPAAPPVGDPQKVITEGSTGASLDDEEEDASWLR